jgi:anti-anti-sigma factor
MSDLDLVVEPVTVKRTVIHVAGDLDAVSADDLKACVRAVGAGSTCVILDLTDVSFIDSVGIGALVGLHRELDAESRMLQLRNLSKQLKRAFEITGVDRILHLT